jgi:hypothetical protein
MRRVFMVQLLAGRPDHRVRTGIYRNRFARFNDAGTSSTVVEPAPSMISWWPSRGRNRKVAGDSLTAQCRRDRADELQRQSRVFGFRQATG